MDYFSVQEDEDVPHRRIVVFYATVQKKTSKQIPITAIELFVERITQYTCYEAILIVDYPISSAGSKRLNTVTSVRWQVFKDSDLTYNPTTHVDVPEHELLTAEEAEAKIREMKTHPTHVPLIKISDPIVRYFNWPVGGLIRIHRNDYSVSILSPNLLIIV